MLQGLWAAASGMSVQSGRLDGVAVDLANATTPGYKSVDRPPQEASAVAALGPAVPSGQMTLGAGVVLGPAQRDWSQGALEPTGRPLDLAIDGPGFFRVQLSGGQIGLTRAGNFQVDAAGNLVDPSGDRVLGVGGQPIQVGTTGGAVTVGSGGIVTVAQPKGPAKPVGRIALSQPASPAGLAPGPHGTWIAGPASGPSVQGTPGASGLGLIRSGVLESSNVNVAAATVAMVAAQQAYTLNAQAVRASDQMWSEANQLLA